MRLFKTLFLAGILLGGAVLSAQDAAPVFDDLDDFMSMHDFLERFRIKRSTFYKYLDRQYFKLYKLGGSNYVKKSEIKNALERGMI